MRRPFLVDPRGIQDTDVKFSQSTSFSCVKGCSDGVSIEERKLRGTDKVDGQRYDSRERKRDQVGVLRESQRPFVTPEVVIPVNVDNGRGDL